jgi:hypothetical protein
MVGMPVDHEDISFRVDGDVIEREFFLDSSEEGIQAILLDKYLHLHLHGAGDEHPSTIISYCKLHSKQFPQLDAFFLSPIFIVDLHQVETAFFFLQSNDLFVRARLHSIDFASCSWELVFNIK